MIKRIMAIMFMGVVLAGAILFTPGCDILDQVQHSSSSSSSIVSSLPVSSISSVSNEGSSSSAGNSSSVVSSVSSVASSNPNLTNNLVAEYLFNGDANDTSGNGNHGINIGCVLTNDRFGKPDSAYSFSNSYVFIPFVEALTNEFTISAWVSLYTASPSSIQAIVEPTNFTFAHFQLGYAASGTTESIYTMVGVNTNVIQLKVFEQLPTNSWRHLVITCKSGDVNTYENGTLLGHSAGTYDFVLKASCLFIGRGYNGRYLNGVIDDVRLYKKALTASEVSQLYHEGGWGE